jgi:hypothetical protein
MYALINNSHRALKGTFTFLLFLFLSMVGRSQELAILYPNQDSTLTENIKRQKIITRDSLKLAEKMDTLRIYKKIKHIAQFSRFTKFLYDATFVDPEPKEYPVAPEVTSKEKKEINPYQNYQHAIIRRINIYVYDPFGHNVNDTVSRKVNYSQRIGNMSHIRSRKWIINNRLLFKKNDTINPLAISETERLLRSAVFINDAKISILPTKSEDSVDVEVVVQDKWSVTIPLLITDVAANAKFRNQNLFGLGQQFEQYVGYSRPNNTFDYNGYYAIDNIDNTYISGRVSYAATASSTNTGISFNRGFFSPLTPWAGGVSVFNTWSPFNYTDALDSSLKQVKTDALNYDVWTGRAFKFSSDKSFFSQSANIITGWRFYKNQYLKRPSVDLDPQQYIYNSSAFVGNVGFAVQEYYKDKYIHRFGANEDVPEGFILQYIYGGVKKEFTKLRYYSGVEVARAKHLKFGYVSATFSYGVFFNKYVANDITTNFNLYYFSNLKSSGRWYFRQFVYYNLVYGANKLFNETVTLSGSDLYGFSPGSLAGNTKMVLNSETVAYAPYKFIGFKFAPVLLAGFGMVGDPQHPVRQSPVYQGYSLGVMIRNENLVSSTFQVTFGYYPFLPDGATNVFTYNPVTSFTLRVRAFAVSSPGFIPY